MVPPFSVQSTVVGSPVSAPSKNRAVSTLPLAADAADPPVVVVDFDADVDVLVDPDVDVDVADVEGEELAAAVVELLSLVEAVFLASDEPHDAAASTATAASAARRVGVE